MTKDKILKLIDKLIEDEKEAIEQYHDAIQKLTDSPRIVSTLGMIYEEETRHITQLQDLKKAVEEHNLERGKAMAYFNDCYPYPCDDGIVITEDETKDE